MIDIFETRKFYINMDAKFYHCNGSNLIIFAYSDNFANSVLDKIFKITKIKIYNI